MDPKDRPRYDPPPYSAGERTAGATPIPTSTTQLPVIHVQPHFTIVSNHINERQQEVARRPNVTPQPILPTIAAPIAFYYPWEHEFGRRFPTHFNMYYRPRFGGRRDYFLAMPYSEPLNAVTFHSIRLPSIALHPGFDKSRSIATLNHSNILQSSQIHATWLGWKLLRMNRAAQTHEGAERSRDGAEVVAIFSFGRDELTNYNFRVYEAFKLLSFAYVAPQWLPQPSSLNILSLPDELLVEIFDAVKTYRPANGAKHISFASSSEDIANTRLVCRRFAACSSHLLVHHVRVEGINPESLERLEAISQHPTIGKGVHIVRLVAKYYTPRLATDLRKFAGYAVNTVFGQSLRYKEAFEEEERQTDMDDPDEVERLDIRQEKCAAVMENVKAVLKTWSRASIDRTENGLRFSNNDSNKPDQEYMILQRRNSGERDEVEEARHMRLLHLAHALYRLRFNKQEKLRRDGAFIHRFAAAMARMPRAKGLEIHDFEHNDDEDQDEYERDVFPDDPYAGLLDIDSITQPMSWSEATDRELGDPPVELLFRLPVAIQKVGARLDRIAIQTTTCAEHYYPLLKKANVRDILDLGMAISSMKLKNFIFLHQAESKPRVRRAPSQEDVDAFDYLITAMTNSDALERLWVRLDSGWSDGGLDPDRRLSLGPLLLADPDSLACWGQPAWKGLRDVHLSNFALHLSDLERFAAQLRESNARLDFLTLQRVHLLSGTWSEALELLRGVDVGWEKEVVEPTGAECDDVTMMLGGRYDVVFGRLDGISSLAEDFVNGDTEQNPLRDNCTLEMEDFVDREEVLVEVMGEDESGDLLEDEPGYDTPNVVSQVV
ncbi:hypothetical protein VMCG_10699 [Cytospora schulzeri]|uniref:F-box domain-containing protein n=1 Tax=Cytospora schulzeri TaxID=448051 RepID=A0A423V926_9PEZI|nr:hypothetical protein VMCG_10699 [Valsa malicola]